MDKGEYKEQSSISRYRQRSIQERKVLFWISVSNVLLNLAVGCILVANVIHHW